MTSVVTGGIGVLVVARSLSVSLEKVGNSIVFPSSAAVVTHPDINQDVWNWFTSVNIDNTDVH